MAPAAKVVKATKGGKPTGGLHMFFGPPGGSQSKATLKASGTSQVRRRGQPDLLRVAHFGPSHLPLDLRRPSRRHLASLTLYNAA